jgi:hypothetical protein
MKGGEWNMARLNYLAAVDAVHYYQKYRPVLDDLNRDQLQILMVLLLNGEDLDKAFDMVMGRKNKP